jgi:hypothetical protein
MNMWRVGEDMGSKETDRCPLTVAPARAKVYVEVDGPVSSLTSRCQSALTRLLIVRPMFDAEVKTDV